MNKKIAIFASGTGSNFNALTKHIQKNCNNAEVVCLICDKPKAPVIDKAYKLGIDTFVISLKNYDSKEQYEQTILNYLVDKKVDLILLAGYLKIIGHTILNKYQGRIINIHPSLLPNYPGLHAMERSFNDLADMGVTVHYVDEGLDTGSIIKQAKINYDKNENFDDIEIRMHELEHQLYIEVVNDILKGE